MEHHSFYQLMRKTEAKRAKNSSLGILILILLVKPSGLLGRGAAEKV